MPRSLLAILGLTLLLGTSAAPALAATDDSRPDDSAGIGIRLLDIPVATQTDPRARSYIVDNVAPGTAIQRRVQIQNNTATDQDVRLYAGAARIVGDSFVGEDGAKENELTTWIGVEEPSLQLAAGESSNVMVTITVPDDAAEGEQYAAIWAEVRSSSTANVVSASRVGIRVYLSVAPGNGPAAAFEINDLSGQRTKDGIPQVTATVTNTGGRALDVTGQLTLSEGPSGLSAGPFSLDRTTTIAPGNTSQITFTLADGIPAGPWNGKAELSSGLLVHEIAAKITFPGAGEGGGVQTNEPVDLVWLAWTLGIVSIAGVGGWTLYLIKRRRQKNAASGTGVLP